MSFEEYFRKEKLKIDILFWIYIIAVSVSMAFFIAGELKLAGAL